MSFTGADFEASRDAAWQRNGRVTGLVRYLETLLDAERGRWALWIPVLFGCGIAVYFALPVEPPAVGVAGAILMALALRLVFRANALGLLVTSALLCMACGLGAGALRTAMVHAPIITKPSGSVEITGWVERWEAREGQRDRLTLRIKSIRGWPDERLPTRVRVTASADATPRVGQPARLRARLLPPPEPVAPGAFDFGKQAYFMQLGAVGYAVSRLETADRLGPAPIDLRLRARIAALRAHVGERIEAVLSDRRAGLAKALIIGERAGIPEEIRDALRRSGLAHILAISGLHMAIMAGSLYWLVRLLLTLAPGVALRFPIKKWAAAAALVGAFFYLLLSGAAISTQRAFLMNAVILIAVMLDRPAVSLRNVLLAALVILALMPESLLDVGFQMSFAAAGALVAVYERTRLPRLVAPRRDGRYRGLFAGLGVISAFLIGIAATTLIAGLAVAPIAAYHFHHSVNYSLAGNLLAMPVVSLWVMPSALFVLLLMPLGMEAVALKVMADGVDVVIAIAEWVGSLPGAVVPVPAFPLASLGLMVLGALWLFIWRAARWRYLGLGLIGAGAIFATQGERPDIFIEREGKVVAVRGADGRLIASPGRAGQFSLEKWLEADGDVRKPGEVRGGPGMSCDDHSCLVRSRGLVISILVHAAALGEDCQRADIVLTPLRAIGPCPGPKLIITGDDLRVGGAHTVRIEGRDGKLSLAVQTTAQARGARPWSVPADAADGD
jgi:competence protein ComEC